ncbi:MAG: choice-of-anchor L domain-containing protein [Flavobacteriales bacterium]|nr:choice-of-anchor L domain-containing protein [Flavobacteriales bacterium]
MTGTMRFQNTLRRSLTGSLIASALMASAQLTVSPQADLQQLAANITGPGVTISNPTITCHAQGFGVFSYTGTSLGADEGVVLTTGRITDAPGPNNNGGNSNWFAQNTAGDAVLNAVTGRTTMDACKFEFDIIPTGDSLSFNFVFASEEYNEWVGSQYNDVFGFFISGPGIVGDPNAGNDKNIALIPGSNQPVTINNVNNGSNSAYYQDNTGGAHIQYDGFTRNLMARTAVNACQSYHLKLIIADASDRKFDSGVFIEKIKSNNVTMQAFTASGSPDMVEGCNPGWVRFSRPFPRPTPLSIQYYIQGSATNGTDYSAITPTNPALAKTIQIPANQTYVDRPVNPLSDALNESTEYLTFILGNPFCPAQSLDTLQFNIVDTLIATVSPGNVVLCAGDSVQYTVTGGASYAWSPAATVSSPTSAVTWVHPSTNTNYTVTITEGTCSRTVTRQVRVSHLSLTGNVTQPLCNASANGAIDLGHTGGFPPYTYAWTGPNGFTASTQDITGLAPGTYTVVVNDAACTRTQSFNVIAPAVLGVTTTPSILPFGQNIACNGGSTGSIATTITGGVAPYTAAWSGPNGFTSASPSLSGLAAGPYDLLVTDVNGCTVTSSVTLTQPQPMSASISATTPVLCFGDGLGGASATITGGIPPYTYAWGTTPSQSTPTATGLAAGTYPVTITDGYGCTASATAVVAGPTAPLGTALNSTTQVLCFGNSTGSASITVSGGTPDYTTTWNTSPAQTGTNATGLPAGTWTATVTDANGCSTTRDVIITQPVATLAASVSLQADVACFGGSTGSATVSASGGTGPYTYGWSTIPAQNTATATGLSAGTWTCTVSDLNNCSTAVTATISQPASTLSTTIAAQMDVACHGSSTGSASITANGGTAPYTFAWNTTPVQSSATALNLSAGTWTCSVTDANGCSTTHSVTITQPAAPLSTSLSAQTNVSCSGGTNGAATILATGGSSPYTYSWNTNPVQNAATASGLSAGTWTCTVTDANGCSAQRTVTITEPVSALAAAIGTTTNVACHGEQSGSISVVVSGGTAPYSQAWNTTPAQNGTTANGLPAGAWTCTVTDANGCVTSASASINQPTAALSAAITAQTNVLIFGQSTGSATVAANAGTAPYTYAWSTSPVQTTATASGLAAGGYLVVVTDANGCSTTATVAITQPGSALAAAIGSQVNVACHGDATGSATASASGGVAPYSFLWNTTPAQNGATATGLPAGTWTVTVTDANGAVSTGSVNITEPVAPLAATLSAQTNVSCHGDQTGTATVNVSGGTPGYTLSWNTTPAQNGAQASGLGAGTYICSVIDANGCTTAVSVTITGPAAALSAVLSSTTDVACHGGSTGSATVTANGGTAPYAYDWNTAPQQTSAQATGLSAGTWTCTVTDANGCSTNIPATIAQPAQALSVLANSTAQATCGIANGAANATASGGTAPYGYQWSSTPVQTSASLMGVDAGGYTVTVTDANGCAANAGTTITSPSTLTMALASTTDQACFGSSSGQATVAASGGIAPYTYTWNTVPVQVGATASGLAAGSYTATVTDGSGCSTSIPVVINGPAAPLTLSTTSTTNVLCFAAATGGAEVSASGGTAPYQYIWNTSPTVTGDSIGGLAAGVYAVSVTDANGCTANSTVTITQPTTEIVAFIENFQHESCFGAQDGWVTLDVVGGSGSYTMTWNTVPPQSGPTAVGLGAGIYTLTVTDDNGCSIPKFYPVNINGPSAPLATALSAVDHDGFAISCPGGADGQVFANTTGGTAPYTYAWTGPNGPLGNATQLAGLSAGSYEVTTTDVNGCSTTVSITLGEPAPLAIGASITTAACMGTNTGAIDATVTGGTSPYTIQWNGPGGYFSTSTDITGLMAGVYTATLTDAHGCTNSFPFNVTQPGQVAVSGTVSTYAGGQNITCDGASDGSIDITATGGIAPYTYAWSGPAITNGAAEDLSGLVAGSYSVVVTDANGCDALAQFSLNAPAPLTASLTNTLFNGADLSCANATDGAIDAGITGGTSPYTFTWNGPNGYNATTEDITALGAGTYTLVVNDANGCTTSATLTLDQPEALIAVATSPTYNSGSNISCDGASNGSIDLQLTGGTGFVQVSWSGPNGFTSSAPSPTGLDAGTYTLVTTDANGCQATDTIVLSAPPPITLSGSPAVLANGTNLLCDQSNDGAIDLTVSGGAGNTVFQWTGTGAFTASTEDVNGLGAGSYTVNVIDQNGCSASTNFTLTAPAPLQATSSASPVACFASPTGALDLSITGGTLPYTYLWSGPGAFSATTEDISGLFAGGYIATITDASGCTLVHGATVTQPNTFQVSAVQPQYTGGNNVSCHGANDASIDVTVAGGVAPYYFAWSGPNGFVAITEDITGIGAGSYILVITDQNGCSTLLNYSVTGPDALALGLTPALFAGGANTGCSDSQDGYVDASVSGGIQPYTYAWTGPNGLTSTSEDITGLEAGTYVLVVTDVLGCSITDSVNLVPATPVAATPNATVLGNGANVSCADATDGSINLAINGGAQPYTVIWSGPNGTSYVQEDLSNVPAGTYAATITDLNGCSTTASITLDAPDTLTIDLTASLYGNGFNLPCQGAAEGTLSASVNGGSPGYSYTWSGPNGFAGSGAVIDSLVAGTYTVQVSDAAGCSITSSFTLTEPITLNLTSAISDAGFGYAVSCAGNDGTIDVNASGGTTPYVFDWTGPNGFASLNEDLANLQAGTYQLQVSDANGCAVTRTFDLLAPAPVQLGTTVTGTICDNATDGAIDLAVSGGVQPMTFSWTGSNGLAASTEDLASLPGGTYSVIVTDAMNCQATTSALVLASAPIDLGAYVSTYGAVNIACAGDSSGVIELSIAGGAGTLDVQWTGPNGYTADTTELSGLHAGTYTATITDANGCTADTTITLVAPTAPIGATLSAALQPSSTNISCTGGNDGSIDATVTGGTLPYTFAWRGPDSTSYATEDLTALLAGTYDLVITDANQCTFTTSITLTEPDSALALSTAVSQYTGGTAVTCDGMSDGWASVAATGGSGGNTVNWSGPNGFVAQGDSIGGLAAGTYTATITDMNGCSTSASINLDAPQPINATVTPMLQAGGTVISCAGASDGMLQAGATGGTAGYTFTWSGPGGATATGATATGIGAGSWCLLVTDTNGCTVQACETITSPLPIDLGANTSPETCGGSNGSIDLTINGGTGPFGTTWSNGSTLEDPAGLVEGSYTVTVTDANGCSADTTLVVNGSPMLAISALSTDNLCNGASDGAIDLTPMNGTAPFSFVWSNGDATEDITGLAAGTYSVLVSDASGCTWSDTLVINAPPALEVSADVLVHGNGYNISTPGGSNGAIALTTTGGTAPYTYAWSNGPSTAGVNALAAGTYTVLITDANGCTTTMTFTLTDPDGLAMPTGFSPNGDGANDSYVVQGLDAYSSRQLIVFNRWGNVVYESPNYRNNWTGENSEGEQLPNGTYFVILRLNEGAETLQNYVDLRR